jgi:DNA-binding transcriptional LysR family regulator
VFPRVPWTFPTKAQPCAKMHNPLARYTIAGMADEAFNWNDLRYLLGAVRAGTLAGASRAMGVEHTTIGRRLTSLERSLGAPLFLRGPEGLRLTQLGEEAVPLVEEVERAVAAVADLVAQRRSRVRLAVPSGFTALFTARIGQLQKEHPKLSLELVSGARRVDLKKGEADLAIRVGPVVDKELVTRKLGEVGYALYASEGYLARRGAPRNPNDLEGHDVIGYDPSLAGIPVAKWLEERAASANVVMRGREMTDMLTAAATGVGLAVLPCVMEGTEPKLARLTSAPVATRNISLVYRREAKLSQEVRAVVRMVVEVMQENAALVSGSK